MAKMGRPEKPIDWEQFEKLCALHCTQSDIADVLKFDVGTLSHRVRKHYGDSYPEVYKKCSAVGRCSLRRYQFNQARTNATMAIWLGKQYLGQKDNNTDVFINPEIINTFTTVMKQISDAKLALEKDQKEQIEKKVVNL